jgi:hypothetical protein
VNDGVQAASVVVCCPSPVSFPSLRRRHRASAAQAAVAVAGDVVGKPGPHRHALRDLAPSQCTQPYQPVGLVATATLSNGATRDVTACVVLSSASPAVTVGGTTVRGVHPGQAAIQVDLYGLASGAPGPHCD